MNKNIVIIFGILTVLLLVVLIFFTLSKNSEAPVNQGNNFPTTTPVVPAPTATTLMLSLSSGGTVPVKNFLRDTETVTDATNKGYYYLGNHIPQDTSTPPPNLPYVIEYIESTQYFNISLLREPLADSRIQAEQYMLEHLGISKENMCKLKYTVSVPNFVNTTLAGGSLGFSFCPGAIKL